MTEFIILNGYNINIYQMKSPPKRNEPVRATQFLGNERPKTKLTKPSLNPHQCYGYIELRDKTQYPNFKIELR